MGDENLSDALKSETSRSKDSCCVSSSAISVVPFMKQRTKHRKPHGRAVCSAGDTQSESQDVFKDYRLSSGFPSATPPAVATGDDKDAASDSDASLSANQQRPHPNCDLTHSDGPVVATETPTAARSSGNHTDLKAPGSQRETFGGFSVANNLLDGLATGSLVGPEAAESWGNSLGLGLSYGHGQGEPDNSARGNLGAGLALTSQDPAIMHVSSGAPCSAHDGSFNQSNSHSEPRSHLPPYPPRSELNGNAADPRDASFGLESLTLGGDTRANGHFRPRCRPTVDVIAADRAAPPQHGVPAGMVVTGSGLSFSVS